jgi:hypothetical protein
MRIFDGFDEWFCRREHALDRLEQHQCRFIGMIAFYKNGSFSSVPC